MIFAWASGVLLIQITVNVLRAVFAAESEAMAAGSAVLLSTGAVPVLWFFVPFTGGASSLGVEIVRFRKYMSLSPLSPTRRTAEVLGEIGSSPVTILVCVLSIGSIGLSLAYSGRLSAAVLVSAHLACMAIAAVVYRVIFSLIGAKLVQIALSLMPRVLLIAFVAANLQVYVGSTGLTVRLFGRALQIRVGVEHALPHLRWILAGCVSIVVLTSIYFWRAESRTHGDRPSRLPRRGRTRQHPSLTAGTLRLSATGGATVVSAVLALGVGVVHHSQTDLPAGWLSAALVLVPALISAYPLLNVLHLLEGAEDRVRLISVDNNRAFSWLAPGLLIRAVCVSAPSVIVGAAFFAVNIVVLIGGALILSVSVIWALSETISVSMRGKDPYTFVSIAVSSAASLMSHWVLSQIPSTGWRLIAVMVGFSLTIPVKRLARTSALRRYGKRVVDVHTRQ